MPLDLNTALARTLVDELARGGVRFAAVAPGSRSTPLVLALADDPRISVELFLDERSAAFYALGTARATGVPGVVLCTSGTAAAEMHPAVLEAHHGRVPLLVCTANRPPELQGVGAPQTVDQHDLFGRALRWFASPSAMDPRPEARATWRPLAARAVLEAIGPPAGPVQLDLPFAEPLLPTGCEVPEPPGRAGGRPWTQTPSSERRVAADELDRLAEAIAAEERGLVVAGWGTGATAETVEAFAAATGWPVLADPLSGVRSGPHAISTYEGLLRAPGFASHHEPRLVLRLGAPLTSRTASEWLDAFPTMLVDPDATWLDPRRVAHERLVVDAGSLLMALTERSGTEPRSDWCESWLGNDRAARVALDRVLDGWRVPSEPRVARDLVASLPDGATLVVASSMPVRAVEWFSAPRCGVRFVANRGVNGIDGLVSTAIGVAAATVGPVVGLCGDLSFLHDTNGLLGATRRDVDLVLVVVDNDGGGIFSFLAHSELDAERAALFSAPHGLDLAALAALHGIETREVVEPATLPMAVVEAMAAGGVQLVLVRTSRDVNVAHHREVWDAIAASAASVGA